MDSTPVVFWFRRDLRLTDHPALAAAAAAGPVLGLFINDEALRRPSGAARLAFLSATLGALDADMGGALVVRSGSPAEVLRQVLEDVGGTTVFATDDFGPYGRSRDTRVGEQLAADGLTVHYLDSPYAVPPNSIVTGGGTPYKVFTPFFRACYNG